MENADIKEMPAILALSALYMSPRLVFFFGPVHTDKHDGGYIFGMP